jgi:hypothetical protein
VSLTRGRRVLSDAQDRRCTAVVCVCVSAAAAALHANCVTPRYVALRMHAELAPPRMPHCPSLRHRRRHRRRRANRYQIIAGGLEQRFLDVTFASRPALANAGSFILRTGNLYLGAGLIVDWLRFVGVQHSAEEEVAAAVPTKGRGKAAAAKAKARLRAAR